jgi:hypothetical protein
MSGCLARMRYSAARVPGRIGPARRSWAASQTLTEGGALKGIVAAGPVPAAADGRYGPGPVQPYEEGGGRAAGDGGGLQVVPHHQRQDVEVAFGERLSRIRPRQPI